LKDLSIANATGSLPAAAESALKSAIDNQATNAGVTAPDIAAIRNLDAPTNFLSLVNDQIRVSGTAYSLSDFATGVTDTVGTLGFPLFVNGMPIPVNTAGDKTMPISIAAELTGNGRVLQIMIDNVTLTDTGTISAAIPTGATMYVYGKGASGATGNLRLVNPTNAISNSSNLLTLDMGSIFDQISAAGSAANQPIFQTLSAPGLYNVKLVLSNVELRKTDGSFFVPSSIQVTGSGQSPLTGASLEGKIDFQ
jgi:hypothetical protein